MIIESIARRAAVAAALFALAVSGVASAQLRELQLTFDEFDHINPVWGPDLVPLCDERGDFIAYEYVDANGRHQLALQQFRIGGGLTPPVLLTDPASGTENRGPQFAPNGEFVVYVKQAPGSASQVFMVNIDAVTTGFPPEVPIAAGDAEHRNPRISPDGTMVAYEKKRSFESTWQIWTYCLVCGEETRRSLDSTQDHGSVAWAPNSASFVFTRTKWGSDSPTQVVRYDFFPLPDRVREVPLTADAGATTYASPAWTIDDVDYGQYVVALRRTSVVAPWQIVQIDQTGTLAVEELTGRSDSDCPLSSLNWSFSGVSSGPENSKKLVATATRFLNGQTIVVRVMNSLRDAVPRCPTVLQLSGLGGMNPRWDPNNTNTIYQKKVGDHWQIFILDAVF